MSFVRASGCYFFENPDCIRLTSVNAVSFEAVVSYEITVCTFLECHHLSRCKIRVRQTVCYNGRNFVLMMYTYIKKTNTSIKHSKIDQLRYLWFLRSNRLHLSSKRCGREPDKWTSDIAKLSRPIQ